jgi:hypothetical protein
MPRYFTGKWRGGKEFIELSGGVASCQDQGKKAI